MGVRGVIGIASLLLFVLAFTIAEAEPRSEPPAPTPHKASQKPEQQSEKKEQSGHYYDHPAAQSPPQINFSPSPQAEEVPADSRYKHGSKPSAEWWLVVFTGGLVLAAFLQLLAMWVQARATTKAIKSSDSSAKAAEKSADIAERTLVASQRAFVFATGISSAQNVWNGRLNLNPA